MQTQHQDNSGQYRMGWGSTVVEGISHWVRDLFAPRCESCGGAIIGRRSWAKNEAFHPACLDVSGHLNNRGDLYGDD